MPLRTRNTTRSRKRHRRRTTRNSRGGRRSSATHKFRIHTKPDTSQHMTCSPAAEKTRVVSGSCFSSSILKRIQKAHNAKHPSDKIIGSEPIKIYQALREKMHGCGKEDCWLKDLPQKDREYLDAYTFAPDYPETWKTNPTEWLSNFDIENILFQYEDAHEEFLFLGPTSIDFDKVLNARSKKCVWQELCDFSVSNCIRSGKQKVGIVFNLDKHDESGSHWVSMFIDFDNAFIFYFDSAANPTPPEISQFVKRVQKQAAPKLNLRYIENYPHNHQKSNTECGMYSLFFIKTMLTGRTDFDPNLSIDERISLFTRERIPDKYVQQFRTKYFNTPDKE